MEVLHPANKIEYDEGQKVSIRLHAEDGRAMEINGFIRGKSSEHIIDFWIVQFEPKLDTTKYSCVTIPHTAIKPFGDNRPYLSEGVSRI